VVRLLALIAIGAAVLATSGLSGASAAPQSKIRANVITIPPKVQEAGRGYLLRVRIVNRGSTFKPICVDFSDDDNSWLIESRYRAYDSDTFCAGTLRRGQSRTLSFLVIAAKDGAHRMTLTIGKGRVFSVSNDAVIDDEGALFWEGNFVIV
jgi:hypothetical protein